MSVPRGAADEARARREGDEPIGRRLDRPSFISHLLLLWRMRLWAAANVGRGQRLPSAIVHLPALLPGLVLGTAAYLLMVHPAVSGDTIVSRFFLGLICFVAALVWCAWPILSAGVDDHSELSRYVAFPISRLRLLVASTLSGLLEPIAFIVYAPVVGASIGYARGHGIAWPLLSIPLFLAFVSMCAVWSRVGLHLVLRVLRGGRGAEALGVFLVLLIVAGLVLPPVDTSWMYEEGGGFGAIDADVLESAGIAFGRVPPGYLAEGLRHLADGRPLLAFLELFGLFAFTLIGLVVANALLASASRRMGRPFAKPGLSFARAASRLWVLVRREALDLWRNPRARLLAGVPFVLGVLLRLLSGRDLFEHFLGPSADAWLMGGMALYGAVLVLSTFAHNAFAYDGHGLRLLLVSPVPPAQVLLSKNLVHGLTAVLLGGAICLFYALYLGSADVYTLCTSMATVLALVPVGLFAGNFLSAWFPVKFHASLQRRDRPPLASAVLGLAALAAGASSLPLAMSRATADGPGPASLGVALCCAAVAWMVYVLCLPLSISAVQGRKEAILGAVTRS